MSHFESYNTSDLTTGATALAGNASLPNPIVIQTQQDGSLVYTCKSDVAGTLSIAQSFDGINWDYVQTFAAAAGVGIGGSVSVIAPQVQINYTNGAAAQAYLRLFVRTFGTKTG